MTLPGFHGIRCAQWILMIAVPGVRVTKYPSAGVATIFPARSRWPFLKLMRAMRDSLPNELPHVILPHLTGLRYQIQAVAVDG